MLCLWLMFNFVLFFTNGDQLYSNKWIAYMNKSYYFGIGLENFATAKSNCFRLNSQLVVIANQSIQDFIALTIKNISGEYFLIKIG